MRAYLINAVSTNQRACYRVYKADRVLVSDVACTCCVVVTALVVVALVARYEQQQQQQYYHRSDTPSNRLNASSSLCLPIHSGSPLANREKKSATN